MTGNQSKVAFYQGNCQSSSPPSSHPWPLPLPSTGKLYSTPLRSQLTITSISFIIFGEFLIFGVLRSKGWWNNTLFCGCAQTCCVGYRHGCRGCDDGQCICGRVGRWMRHVSAECLSNSSSFFQHLTALVMIMGEKQGGAAGAHVYWMKNITGLPWALFHESFHTVCLLFVTTFTDRIILSMCSSAPEKLWANWVMHGSWQHWRDIFKIM